MRRTPIRMPGMMPAIKISLTDTPEAAVEAGEGDEGVVYSFVTYVRND